MKTNLYKGYSTYRGDNSRTAVVIPAYRPPAELIELVRKVNRAGMSCFIVDDGNPVGYDWIWQAVGSKAYVLHHDINRGKGAALKTAFTYIKNWCPDIQYIVTMDADGQHLVEDAYRAAQEAKASKGALILGVRDFSGDVPAAAKIENHVASVLFSGISKNNLSDTKTGLRAFDRSLLSRMIMIEGNRDDYEMNQLLTLSDAGRKIQEIPTATIYKGKKKSSPFEIMKGAAGVIRVMLSYSTTYALSYAAEVLLFMLLSLLSPLFSYPLLVSGVISRTVGAAFSWSLNSDKLKNRNVKSPLLRYTVVTCITMVFSLLMLTGFASLGMNAVLAKVAADMITLAGYIAIEAFSSIIGCRDEERAVDRAAAK
ncbi:MAG: glycosyltransferase [Anaerovoracaceae bacterium]|jgi:glycosyltransferase involved in cell wall biosynthesis